MTNYLHIEPFKNAFAFKGPQVKYQVLPPSCLYHTFDC